jgi:hypothetical protein
MEPVIVRRILFGKKLSNVLDLLTVSICVLAPPPITRNDSAIYEACRTKARKNT